MTVNGHASHQVILITGAAGWLGGVLAGELLKDSRTPDAKLILVDIVEPKIPAGAEESAIAIKADLCNPAEIAKLYQTQFGLPTAIYCLHGIMSRGSEDNFALGLRVNIDSIRYMLEATHAVNAPKPIRFIFTSSLAVYGGPLPDVIETSTIATPEGSYGCGKLVAEMLVNEYTRRNFVDGCIMRLPTIVVRPGVPSAATSAFISGIIREPLQGLPAICPVGDNIDSPELSLAAWVASPEVTITNFVQALHVPSEAFLKHTRVVCLPGFTTTVKQELEALEAVAGPEALKLVTFQNDPINSRIVGSWPARFNNKYPLSLGFSVDEGGMIPIVRKFKEDLGAAAKF